VATDIYKIMTIGYDYIMKVQACVVIIVIRGYSLIGKTPTLHVVISGSIPDISKIYRLAREAQWLSGTLKLFRL
jgi:hypothetical protein